MLAGTACSPSYWSFLDDRGNVEIPTKNNESERLQSHIVCSFAAELAAMRRIAGRKLSEPPCDSAWSLLFLDARRAAALRFYAIRL